MAWGAAQATDLGQNLKRKGHESRKHGLSGQNGSAQTCGDAFLEVLLGSEHTDEEGEGAGALTVANRLARGQPEMRG